MDAMRFQVPLLLLEFLLLHGAPLLGCLHGLLIQLQLPVTRNASRRRILLLHITPPLPSLQLCILMQSLVNRRVDLRRSGSMDTVGLAVVSLLTKLLLLPLTPPLRHFQALVVEDEMPLSRFRGASTGSGQGRGKWCLPTELLLSFKGPRGFALLPLPQLLVVKSLHHCCEGLCRGGVRHLLLTTAAEAV